MERHKSRETQGAGWRGTGSRLERHREQVGETQGAGWRDTGRHREKQGAGWRDTGRHRERKGAGWLVSVFVWPGLRALLEYTAKSEILVR